MKYTIILLLAFATLIAQRMDAKSIPFTVDGAQFKHDSSQTLWEMYYSFPDTSLRYISNGNQFVGELYIKMVIYSPHDTVGIQEWIVSNQRDSLHPTVFKNLVGQKLFVLKPGQYMASIRIMDVNDTASHADSKFPVIIRSFSRQNLAISDIEIVSSFNETVGDNTPAFKKGSYNVIPNPAKEYIGTAPSLLTYLEIYNATTDFKIKYTVSDGAKREIFSVDRIRPSVGDAMAETITLPLELLPSGAYYIHVSAFSPSINSTDSASVAMKKFYVLNPDIPPEENTFFSEDELFLASEFATMSDDKIQSEFEKAQYTAQPQEIASYNSLSDIKARQKFLFRFWLARDSDTATAANETLEEFRKQVAYASTFFTNVQIKEGWRTDRGRVRLKYGAPTEVTRVDFNVSGKPYEIWTYNNMQGGNITFCFVDLNGYNNHKLVHSTAMGEVRDERWIERYVRADNFDPNGDLGR